jgi:hypothetical protein
MRRFLCHVRALALSPEFTRARVSRVSFKTSHTLLLSLSEHLGDFDGDSWRMVIPRTMKSTATLHITSSQIEKAQTSTHERSVRAFWFPSRGAAKYPSILILLASIRRRPSEWVSAVLRLCDSWVTCCSVDTLKPIWKSEGPALIGNINHEEPRY